MGNDGYILGLSWLPVFFPVQLLDSAGRLWQQLVGWAERGGWEGGRGSEGHGLRVRPLWDSRDDFAMPWMGGFFAMLDCSRSWSYLRIRHEKPWSSNMASSCLQITTSMAFCLKNIQWVGISTFTIVWHHQYGKFFFFFSGQRKHQETHTHIYIYTYIYR